MEFSAFVQRGVQEETNGAGFRHRGIDRAALALGVLFEGFAFHPDMTLNLGGVGRRQRYGEADRDARIYNSEAPEEPGARLFRFGRQRCGEAAGAVFAIADCVFLRRAFDFVGEATRDAARWSGVDEFHRFTGGTGSARGSGVAWGSGGSGVTLGARGSCWADRA